MNELAIRVNGLGKKYRLGLKQPKYRTLRDSISDAFARPFRSLAARRGGATGDSDPDESIWAVKDLAFEVRRGEALGIIGRNGAGKSTLLKLLSRITEPTSGSIDLYGRVSSLLEVGTGFHSELSGRENIYLNGAILGMRRTEIQRQFEEIVAFSEVERFIDTPVKHYSSGMYLRLAFAVAAHLQTDILIVDEVLAVGDADFQKKCMGKMGSAAKAGRTVLFVSHNMAALGRLCTRAILLDDGNIVGAGETHKVIAQYIQSGLLESGERVWTDPRTAPGDEVATLRAVRALNADGRVTSEFKVTEPLVIEVEFCVLMANQRLDVGLDVTNESGNVVFITSDCSATRWHHRSRPVGFHRSRCHIPGNLLNNGMLTVTAAVVTNPHTRHAYAPYALMIRIVDDMCPGGARGNYTPEWPGGAVRPLLDWTFDFEPSV